MYLHHFPKLLPKGTRNNSCDLGLWMNDRQMEIWWIWARIFRSCIEIRRRRDKLMQKLCKKNACLTDHLIAQGDYPTEGILIKVTIPPGTFQFFGKKWPRGRIVSDSQIFLSPWSCLEGTLSQASRQPSPDMQQVKTQTNLHTEVNEYIF